MGCDQKNGIRKFDYSAHYELFDPCRKNEMAAYHLASKLSPTLPKVLS